MAEPTIESSITMESSPIPRERRPSRMPLKAMDRMVINEPIMKPNVVVGAVVKIVPTVPVPAIKARAEVPETRN